VIALYLTLDINALISLSRTRDVCVVCRVVLPTVLIQVAVEASTVTIAEDEVATRAREEELRKASTTALICPYMVIMCGNHRLSLVCETRKI